jgi:hypothetical protein
MDGIIRKRWTEGGTMDVLKAFRGMLGGRAPEAREAPKVADLLAPTEAMQKEWRRAARADAPELAGMTRAELGREFGGSWFRGLPADRAPREAAVEAALVARSRDLYASHLDEVQRVFALPDAEVRRTLDMSDGELPGMDRPRERAEEISAALSDRDMAEISLVRDAETRGQADRMSPPSSTDWAEHRVGEPAVLAAERDGDWDEVDRARKEFGDGFHLRDPSLREVAEASVEIADRWRDVDAAALSSGQVRMGPEAAGRLLSSAAVYEAGARRDVAIAEAFVDDYARRHPAAMEAWSRQALEVMSEGPAFMRSRHPGVAVEGLSPRQVVSLEAARAVGRVRAEVDSDRAAEVVSARIEPARDAIPRGRLDASSLAAMGAMAARSQQR